MLFITQELLFLFFIYFVCIDEENVVEETRKHKNHYFPTMKKPQLKKNTSSPNRKDENSEVVTYNSQKPVNFLFSNGTESNDDDDSNDEV